MHILTGAISTATVSGGVFTLVTTLDGGQSFEDAFEAVPEVGSGNSNGQTTRVRVQYPDTTANSDWEVMEATYSTTGPKLTRSATIASSTGSAVTFSGTVHVRSVATHKDFHPGDTRILQMGLILSGGDYSNATTTAAAMSDSESITPTVSGSTLLIEMVQSDFRVVGSATNNDVRGLIRPRYQNSSSVWTEVGTAQFIGYVNVTAYSAAPQIYLNPTASFELSDSEVNASGNWVWRMYGESSYANVTIEEYACYWKYTEYI